MAYQPRYTNLVTLFTDVCSKYGARPAFGTRRREGWEWTTYEQFGELVARARSGLSTLGVQAHDRVAIISNNRLEWVVTAYAALTRGAAYVPMYEAQLDRDWQHILRDSGAKACFVGGDAIEQRVRALGDLPELEQVISFDDARYRALLEAGAAAPVPAVQPSDSDLASLTYTSGTTGRPKGVQLTHMNMASNASGLAHVAPAGPDDRSLAFLPWAHVFGGIVELQTMLAIGASLAICERADKLLDYLREVKPTLLFAVPRVWNRIYETVGKQIAQEPKLVQQLLATGLRARGRRRRGERLTPFERLALPIAERLILSKVEQRFGGRLRYALSGAAALSPEVARFMDDLGIEVYEGYGMTESSGCSTANLPGARKIGSVGRALPGTEIGIDKRAPGAQGGDGEIIIYGSGVMAGYHGNAKATREALTEDGGLRTGDLGHLDEDGFLFVTGRVKEIYKLANGKYVAPAPLEDKLQLSPYVAQCVVYGANQPHNVALVVPDVSVLKQWAQAQALPTDTGALLAHPRTRELIREELDAHSRDFKSYEQIRDFVLSGEEMTTQNDLLTPTLKVKRGNVNARFEDQFRALYRGAPAAAS